MAKRAPLLLSAVLLLALALRVWGLTWGLPSATHYFSYHPDESVVLGASLSMNVLNGQILPHFYNYGTFQLYLVNIAATVASAYGGGSLVIKDLAHDWPQWAHFYLAGRALSVLMGVGTVWGVYALGNLLWGRRAGLMGAAFLAVMPLHAQHSHWLTVDVPAAFWGTWTLFWAARVMAKSSAPSPTPPPSERERGKTTFTTDQEGSKTFLPLSRLRGRGWGGGHLLLAGLLAGLAVATKYSMALLLLPIVLAIGQSQGAAKHKAQALAVAVLAMGAAFLFGCPGSLLETGTLEKTGTFLHDVHFEAVHVQNTQDPTFRDTGNGFLYQVTTNLAPGLGWPLLIVTLFCIVYAGYKRTKEDTLLAAFALPYFVLISIAAVRYARYDIPLLPVLALWAGRMAADSTRLPHPFWRKITLMATLLVGLWTLGSAVMLVRPMAQTDPRDAALAYLNAHAPSLTPIAFAVQPWFGTVPVSPDFSHPRPGAWRQATPELLQQRIIAPQNDWNVETLEQQPQWVVLSEYDYRDALRLHDPALERYLQRLRAGWREAAVFSPAPRTDGLPVHPLPHDMLYPNPAIVIFQRKN